MKVLLPHLNSNNPEMLLNTGRAIGRICFDNCELSHCVYISTHAHTDFLFSGLSLCAFSFLLLLSIITLSVLPTSSIPAGPASPVRCDPQIAEHNKGVSRERSPGQCLPAGPLQPGRHRYLLDHLINSRNTSLFRCVRGPMCAWV